MKCPHCTISFHDNWEERYFNRKNAHFTENIKGSHDTHVWTFRTANCPNCDGNIIEVGIYCEEIRVLTLPWRQIHPIGSSRGPVPPDVPANIAADYVEACNVLPISAKASAALSRRCLQNILHSAQYKDKDLAREIQALLDEPDPRKAIPAKLRQTIDGIRAFGNFSAHPINDKTTLQIIDVEPDEAEWCLDVIEEMFEHFYVGPAQALARKAKIDAKLIAAGKPPTKGP